MRVAELLADLLGPREHLGRAGQLVERGDVDGDREGAGGHGAAVVLDQRAAGGQVVQPAGELDEVRRRGRPLEADQVGAEQPLDDRRPPRQLGEQLVGRERDVQEEADGEVGPLLAQQRRDQLQLVVVHPDDGVLGGDGGGALGEPLVDLHVGVPPGAVVLRLLDDVVVERPQRGVGHALVVAVDLVLGQRHRDQRHAAGLERLRRLAGRARPAHPGAAAAGDERLQRGDQPAGAALPARLAVGVGDLVDREPVGDHDHGAVRPRLRVLLFSPIPPPTLPTGPRQSRPASP